MDLSRRLMISLTIGIILVSSLSIYSYGLMNLNANDEYYIHGYLFYSKSGKYITVPVNITTSGTIIQLWTPTIDNLSGGLFTNLFTIGLSAQNNIINFSVLDNGQLYTTSYILENPGDARVVFFLELNEQNLSVTVDIYNSNMFSALVNKFLSHLSNYTLNYSLMTIAFKNLTRYSLYHITAYVVNSSYTPTSIILPHLIKSVNFTNINIDYYPYADFIGLTNSSFYYRIIVSNGIINKSICIHFNDTTTYELDIIQNGTTFQLELGSAFIYRVNP